MRYCLCMYFCKYVCTVCMDGLISQWSRRPVTTVGSRKGRLSGYPRSRNPRLLMSHSTLNFLLQCNILVMEAKVRQQSTVRSGSVEYAVSNFSREYNITNHKISYQTKTLYVCAAPLILSKKSCIPNQAKFCPSTYNHFTHNLNRSSWSV